MTFQNPLTLTGISVRDLLRVALEKKYDVIVMYQKIQAAAQGPPYQRRAPFPFPAMTASLAERKRNSKRFR
jgi:Fe-S cluster assembly ATPase SufC